MEIEDEGLEETIERIVDRRVRERLEEFRGPERSHSIFAGADSRFPTARRRGVLKMLGAGALGFGTGIVPCISQGEVQPGVVGNEDRSTKRATNRNRGTPTGRAAAENVGLVARPGGLQSAINEAAASMGRGRVLLQPGVGYDPGRELHIRKNVDFDFNGGRIVQTGDHDTIFVDHGARIRNGLIDRSKLGSSATSTAVLLDVERAGDDYRNAAADSTAVDIECDVLGSGGGANDIGLQLIGKGKYGIGLGNQFDMQIRNCGKGLDVYTERYLNGPEFQLMLIGNGVGIDHRGTDNFNSTVYGWIQPESGSQIGIRNQTDNESVTFVGEFWDPHTCERYSLQGPKITVLSLAADASEFKGTTDKREYTAVRSWEHERESIYNAESDTTFETRFDVGRMRYLIDGDPVMDIGKDVVNIYATLNDS